MDRERAQEVQAGEAVGDKGGKGCSQESRVRKRDWPSPLGPVRDQAAAVHDAEDKPTRWRGTCDATLLVVGPRAGPFAVFTFSLLVWLLLRSG